MRQPRRRLWLARHATTPTAMSDNLSSTLALELMVMTMIAEGAARWRQSGSQERSGVEGEKQEVTCGRGRRKKRGEGSWRRLCRRASLPQLSRRSMVSATGWADALPWQPKRDDCCEMSRAGVYVCVRESRLVVGGLWWMCKQRR
ncbi:hypothetical protein C0Q70_16929 [Pomacea canaliculata]|uniref:Uncharacterized protein n=1 Tax=Pomacea canaliculata TaxID=400727 RepID=A0A2T7NR67_POMCA|nr:hypothetical protein C0Q70_16929 [Pomacea canaliculata]